MPEKTKACSDSTCSKESCEGCEKNPKSFLEATNLFKLCKQLIKK